MNNRENRIFYDEKKLRWKYSKPAILFVASFFAIIFSVTVASIFIKPALPNLNLGGEALPGRIAPGVALTIKGEKKPAEIASSSIAEENKPEKNATSGKENARKPVVAGFYVNWDDNSFESLKQNIGSMDEMIPEWLDLGSGGEVAVIDQAGQDEAMSYIKQKRSDFKIVPLINNYNDETQSWDNNRLMLAIGTFDARAKTVEDLYQYVKNNNFSGISIDFEDMTDQQIVFLSLFMRELYGKFHLENLEVSQNIPLEDDSFNAKEMGRYCDYLILMAYDQNSISDTLAGPIASQNWLLNSLKRRYLELPPEKYILGVGGYGYDWIDGQASGTELTFQDAMRLANLHNSPISFDPAALNPTFDYIDSNNKLHHAWFLDGVTAFNEIKIGNQLGQPHGYALWRMGSEDPTVWNVFKNIDSLDNSAANLLTDLNYGYDVSYIGQGEILKVASFPKDGKREAEYDEKTGYISKENIVEYPASYIVSRWGSNDGNEKKIALTFDDGPDKKYTPEILNILKKYSVPGTFFVIGANANINSNIIKREYDNGNEIGSHTYTHPNITKIADTQVAFELDLAQRIIEGTIGRKTLLFRPPYAEDIEPETPEQMKPLLITNNEGLSLIHI